MAYKRSRADFERDLQAQESPFVIYGTPLPPLDESSRDDGSYVPIWKQEVTDEKGRKRLHGAFTGGFSAGHFNTVGSKDGWTPSTFVSSRTKRAKDAAPTKQRPEDYMDDEDLADAEEAKKLQTTDAFAGLGSAEGADVGDSLMGLVRTAGETMGVKLLKKMGWREGQGVGPKVRREAKLGDEEINGPRGGQESTAETHLFAPEDSSMISFNRKKDRKGLGYGGEVSLEKPDEKSKPVEGSEVEESASGPLVSSKKSSKKKVKNRGGIGLGILNDTGSDEEDPYSLGPSMSYNRIIGGDKKKKKKAELGISSANPLLNNKPVFVSKKDAAKAKPAFRRCHDGRLPLDGFVLSSDPNPRGSAVSSGNNYPPPVIPEGWKSSKNPSNGVQAGSVNDKYQSTAQVAAAAKLSPKSRAALLGEIQLPGKSVFDYLNPSARDRIASASKNHNLPPALGEADAKSSEGWTKSLGSLVPQLARETALTALGRGVAGWMPYAEDPNKRDRYRTFLEIQGALRPEGTLPERAPGARNDEWVAEMDEFAHAAEIFKPMTGAMASRFTSSSSSMPSSDKVKLEQTTGRAEEVPLLSTPAAKPKTPAEEAAALGLYGPLTRSVETFYPSRLLCKRFNVNPPTHVQADSTGNPTDGQAEGASEDRRDAAQTQSAALPQKRLELVGKEDMDKLRASSGNMQQFSIPVTGIERGGRLKDDETEMKASITTIDPERNEALEKERPGDAVFKAIFGSDSEDD